jgi:SagB-type dehydrogenase family enzyme
MLYPIKKWHCGALLWLALTLSNSPAQDIHLPSPQKTGGLPLMEALNNRKSTRDFTSKEIPAQVLSDLLWAAYGLNRPQQKLRTAPAAWGIHNMDIYVAKADGLYLYDATNQSLKFISNEDVRAQTGTQSYVRNAPVNLVYVADLAQMSTTNKGEFYSIAHAGFIGQNVYLFCASFGLGTVVRDLIDRDALRKTLQLKDAQEIILAQSIGYPTQTSATSSNEDESEFPDRWVLFQNYPNPFNPNTAIRYQLSAVSDVRLMIYDILGRPVRTLVDMRQQAGSHQVIWNGADEHNSPVAAGVYFCHLAAGGFSQVIKLALLR